MHAHARKRARDRDLRMKEFYSIARESKRRERVRKEKVDFSERDGDFHRMCAREKEQGGAYTWREIFVEQARKEKKRKREGENFLPLTCGCTYMGEERGEIRVREKRKRTHVINQKW